jgi:hypothetical protein
MSTKNAGKEGNVLELTTRPVPPMIVAVAIVAGSILEDVWQDDCRFESLRV